MITVVHLSRSFGGIRAVRDVSCQFAGGEVHAIIGPNGAGKTTFFNLLSGRFPPSAGHIRLDGHDIGGHSPASLARRGIARAFQVAQLFPSFTVLENLCCAVGAARGGALRPFAAFPNRRHAARAGEVLELVGLADLRNRVASTLSHGDGKLLDIAIALMLEPRFLLLDEPTAGMGPEERWAMVRMISSLQRALGFGLLFIDHDMDIVFEIARHVVVLSRGAVLADGAPAEIRANAAVVEAYLGGTYVNS
jgi:branched-chain amino acid transport system ATP-binding protein